MEQISAFENEKDEDGYMQVNNSHLAITSGATLVSQNVMYIQMKQDYMRAWIKKQARVKTIVIIIL